MEQAFWWSLVALVIGFLLGRGSRRERGRYVGQPPQGDRGLAPVAGGASDAELRALLAAGKTVEAIKRYRETHGVGLKEAKDAIDALQRRGG